MSVPQSNQEWLEWGKSDPLWGVASAPGKQRGQAGAWTDEDFYALGAAEFAGYLDLWSRYGMLKGDCVEIGCGAGRMTNQLARHFDTVHGIDISPDMIAYAKSHVPQPNIEWHVADGTKLPVPDGSMSGAFSCHVFQHFATVEVAKGYFTELARAMKSGGTLAIHLPLFRNHRNRRFASISRMTYGFYQMIYGTYAKLARMRMRMGGPAYMHGLSYEEGDLATHLRTCGFVDVQFVARAMPNELHTIVLARKS